MEGNKLINSLKKEITKNINVSVIAKIIKINTNNTVNVKPLYKDSEKEMPILVNVPLMQLSSGNIKIEIEQQVGDIVLLIVNDFDVENVLISGDAKEVNTKRNHALDDAIALPFELITYNKNSSYTSVISVKQSGDIILKSNSKVYLGSDSASEGVPLGTQLKTWLDSHTHGSGSAPDSESPSPSEKVVVE